ncbi:MAG: ATP phosphoribosyltransferase regulatory subunit, partial [Rhizobiaceae bacterium]|nr:ATP phosphoribosyltransferase regulatory subunit [Rhizobiaceae bacterium]
KRLEVLRAIDALDRIGIEGVRARLGRGRKDDSGDFTKGIGLDEEQTKARIIFLQFEPFAFFVQNDGRKIPIQGVSTGGKDDVVLTPPQSLDTIRHYKEYFSNSGVELADSETLEKGLDELWEIFLLIKNAGYSDRIAVDQSVVRGLEYYTGPVYEVELTFPVTNEKGQEVVFGSVGGGGRYDDLVKRFTGQPVPATGFSIGVSRLMTALKNLGKLDTSDTLAPVLVTVMDGSEMGRYQKMVQQLRDAGIRAEMYQGNWKKFGNQLKYADRRNCPLAIIQGEDERAAGEVQIKDLIEGKRLSAEIEDNITWRESRPAQVSVAEGDLVKAVQGMLDEQKEDRVKAGE